MVSWRRLRNRKAFNAEDAGNAEKTNWRALLRIEYAIAPHNVCGPLGTIASCHCCASVPNFLGLEWHWVDRPHWHELVLADPPLIEDGTITLPDGPGQGVELNEEALAKYARPDRPLF